MATHTFAAIVITGNHASIGISQDQEWIIKGYSD